MRRYYWIIGLATLVLCTLLSGFFGSGLYAQEARRPQNVKYHTGLSIKEITIIMKTYVQALDVKCEHCHVKSDYSLDAKPEKAITRQMIELTNALNQMAYFQQPKIPKATCYMCHQGKLEPDMEPPPE